MRIKMGGLILLLVAGVSAGCAVNSIEPPVKVAFSSMEDGLVRDCPAPASDSLAPCRIKTTPSLRALQQIAATSTSAVSGESVTFAVSAPTATYVRLTGAIQLPLSQVEGTDLWTATIHVPGFADSRIGYRFITDTMRILPPMHEVRGSKAPKRPTGSAQLHGFIRVDTLWSNALGERRPVVSYVPPGTASKPYDVVYAADGATVRDLAPLVDTLIASGMLPPTVLVGVRAARVVPGDEGSRLNRAREYVIGFDPDSTRFLKHEKFFMDEVSQWAEETLGVSDSRESRTIWGASNGGAFAVAMGLRHPDRFGHVIASSPVYDDALLNARGNYLPEFYLTAGTFEQTTRERTEALTQALRKLHASVR